MNTPISNSENFVHPSIEEVLDNKRSVSTRKQYNGVLKKVRRLIGTLFPSHTVFDRDGLLIEPLSNEIFKAVMQSQSAKELPNGKVTMKSNSVLRRLGRLLVFDTR